MRQAKQFLGIIVLFFLVNSRVVAVGPFIGPPVSWDQWTVDNGTIDTTNSCSAPGITCSILSEENGFRQERVTDTTLSHEFIRIIMTDANAGVAGGSAATSLGFRSENFVAFTLDSAPAATEQMQGVANRTVISDVANGFSSTAEIRRSSFKGAGHPGGFGSALTATDAAWTAQFSQSIISGELSSSFNQTTYTNLFFPDSDDVVGRIQDIDQLLTVSPTEKQKFVQRTHGGFASASAFSFGGGGCTTGCNSILTSGSVTLNGSIVDWTTTLPPGGGGGFGGGGGTLGPTIKATWVGSTLVSSTPPNGQFSFQSVENIGTGVKASVSSNNSLGPVQWGAGSDLENNLGVAPVLP